MKKDRKLLSKENLDRFYPRVASLNGFGYWEIYDSLEHRVLGTTSDWFDALERCYALQDCDSQNPVQLEIPF